MKTGRRKPYGLKHPAGRRDVFGCMKFTGKGIRRNRKAVEDGLKTFICIDIYRQKQYNKIYK